MNTITIRELVELSNEGRLAASSSVTFGQTEAGCHHAIGAERLVEVREAPCGGEVVGGPPIYTWGPARVGQPAGPIDIHFDPVSGEVWWGATVTLRVLPHAGAPLFGAESIIDGDNLAYQRALLRG